MFEEVAAAESRLEQGDLLRLGLAAPFTYGIVVTADCDLDKKKHSRIVTFVPLISETEALTGSLIHDYLSRREEECRAKLVTGFKLDPDSDLPVDSQVLGLVREKGLHDPDMSLDGLDALTMLALLHCGFCPRPTLKQCKDVVSLFGAKWEKAVSAFSDQLASRGDFLSLTKPSLISENVSIAWLRGVSQCPISVIAMKTSEAAKDERTVLKIGRLRSPYVYRLTQMLGQVFSDIGLPDRPKITIPIEVD